MMAMLHSLFLFCLLRCQRAAMLTFYDDGVADNIQSDSASTNGKLAGLPWQIGGFSLGILTDPIVMIAKLGKRKKNIKSSGYKHPKSVLKNNISSDQYDLIVPRTTFYLIFSPLYYQINQDNPSNIQKRKTTLYRQIYVYMFERFLFIVFVQ